MKLLKRLLLVVFGVGLLGMLAWTVSKVQEHRWRESPEDDIREVAMRYRLEEERTNGWTIFQIDFAFHRELSPAHRQEVLKRFSGDKSVTTFVHRSAQEAHLTGRGECYLGFYEPHWLDDQHVLIATTCVPNGAICGSDTEDFYVLHRTTTGWHVEEVSRDFYLSTVSQSRAPAPLRWLTRLVNSVF